MGAGYRHASVLLDSMREAGKTGFGETNFLKYMKYGTVGSTIRFVSNCEDVTDWDISNSSHFNAVDETTDKRSFTRL